MIKIIQISQNFHMFQLFDQGGRYYHVMHARYTIFAISDNPMAREKYRMDGKKMELGVGEFACYRRGGVEVKDNVKNTEFLCRGTFSSRILFFLSFLFVFRWMLLLFVQLENRTSSTEWY